MPSSGIGPVPIRPFSDWKNMLNPAGTWFATRVGMPMPRLTSIPEWSSLAMRLAMMVCASMALLIGDEVIDNWRRRHNVIRGDDPHRNDVLCRHDNGVRRHGEHRIEIASSKGIGQVA